MSKLLSLWIATRNIDFKFETHSLLAFLKLFNRFWQTTLLYIIVFYIEYLYITRKNCLVRVKKEILGWKLCDCRFFAIKWYWQNPQSLSCQPNISFFTLTRQFLRVILLFGIIGLMINYSLLTKSHLFWMKRSIWSPCRKRCRLCAQWVTFLKHT